MEKTLNYVLSIRKNSLASLEYDEKKGFVVVSEEIKYKIIFIIGLLILGSSFLFNTPGEIYEGIRRIIVARSILVSDYFVIGNIGAAMFNAGVLMLIATYISYYNKINMNGPIIAAIFTIAGFSFFGKNIFNIWPVIFGVYTYASFQKEKFSKYLLIAFFGTALGPLVSQVAFGLNLPVEISIVLSILLGLTAGFILPPLANHFVSFHQGFNLYNIGFSCGIVGMFFMSVLRAFNFNNQSTLIVASGYNKVLTFYLVILFSMLLLVGLFLSYDTKKELLNIFRQPGRLVSDFVSSDGFSASLINMALLGFITTGYVLLVKGQLSGPILGGIFTVVGFGAFGKHVKNILPVMLGVFLATLLQIWSPSSTGALLAALFGTTLAPIAGYYGFKYGVIAGFVHMAIVMNVGYLHGGMNLYNNGLAGGFVAAILVPLFDSIRRTAD